MRISSSIPTKPSSQVEVGYPPVGIGGVQTPPKAEGGATRAQSLRRVSGPVVLNGTIIRIDPYTGAALSDNPLFALDAYSRKVVGWALDRTLAPRLPLAALTHALAARHPPPGLVHHSDRDVQYASGEYVSILRTHHMIPSMSRPANPYDASCESFMKTLKREEIYANTYRDLDHLRTHLEAFIERCYNRNRVAFSARLSTTGGVRTHHGSREHVERSDPAVVEGCANRSNRGKGGVRRTIHEPASVLMPNCLNRGVHPILLC